MSKTAENVAPQNGDKSLFFLTLSAVCVWLLVDVAIGKNYLGNVVSAFFGKSSTSSTTRGPTTTEEVKEAEKNAPDSSAIGSNHTWGSNRANASGIVGDTYGPTR